MDNRISRWWHAHAPRREVFENSRILAPIAHRVLAPELWRFTRRSVPRGVALGLLVGIFLMIPGLQVVGAAFLALPVRANIPLAAAMTFFSNPATTPLILWASVYVGNFMLGRTADVTRFMALIDEHASIREWTNWIVSEAAPALVFGLAVISVVIAAIGYLLASWLWRAHLFRKWKARRAQALVGDIPTS